MDYKLSDFDYHLPENLIAQTPLEPRDSSRLLCLGRQDGQIHDKVFRDIADILTDNDVLVVNQTRVIKARLKGQILKNVVSSPLDKGGIEGGRACEIFLHKQISDTTWECLVYPGKKLKPGACVHFLSPDSDESGLTATILELTQH